MTETATVATPKVDTPWFTKQEACAYLRISMDTLDRYISSGDLDIHKVKGRQSVRLHRDDLDAVLVRHPRPRQP